MATTLKRHSIVNPGGHRRKRVNAKRRHMSAKQIRHFGTKRQKAALKASRSNRPKAKTRHAHRARKRASNPGEILSLTLGNPKRRKAKMASTKRNRRRSSAHRTNPKRRRRQTNARRRHNRRTNPVMHNRRRRTNVRHKRHAVRHNYRRRNPGGAEVTNLAIEAVAALGGFVGSRWLTQLVLTSNNTGVMGYFGNAAATALLGIAAHYAMPRNKSVRDGVILGGAMGIVARVVEDYTPLGSALSQQGIGDYGMAAYMPSNAVVPQRYLDAWNSAQVQIPSGWGSGAGTAMVPAGAGASGAGVSGLYDGGGLSLY